MSPRRQEQLLVADQAAAWMLRLKLEGTQAHAPLLEWLRESPLHVQEFLLACGIEDSLTRLDPNNVVDVDALIARAHSKSKVIPLAGRLPLLRQQVGIQATRGRRLWITASGMAAALLAMLTWVIYLSPHSQDVYATEVGDQRTFKLDDGSVVVLNTGSRIRVAYTDAARDIYLDRGQALFQVYHDAMRPFRVHAASTVVQAIGTQFDVRRFADRTTVAVVEGVVQVSTNEPPAGFQPPTPDTETKAPMRVSVGEIATVDSTGTIAPPERVNPDLATAWRRQRVVFVDTSLDDIAGEFNRYNVSPHLRIEGDELKTRVFSGSFNAYSPESFLTYLSQETDLLAERRGDEVVIRPR